MASFKSIFENANLEIVKEEKVGWKHGGGLPMIKFALISKNSKVVLNKKLRKWKNEL